MSKKYGRIAATQPVQRAFVRNPAAPSPAAKAALPALAVPSTAVKTALAASALPPLVASESGGKMKPTGLAQRR